MTRHRLFGLVANLALSASVLCVCLGGAETLARWHERRTPVGAAPEGELIRSWATWHEDFYVFGRSLPRWPPDGPINRDGLRDAHHARQAASGQSRVLLLGDSVTYGFGVLAERAYPQVLQQLLDEQGRPLEIFNVAAPGWSTRQERIAYERLARPYGARTALLAVCLNDPLELYQNLASPPAWLLALHQRSALFRRLVNAGGRELETVEGLNAEPDGLLGRAALARFGAEVSKLREELARDDVRLRMLVLPYRFQVRDGAPGPLLQARLLALARGAGMEAQDLLPVLRPLGEAAFIDYNHLSPEGHVAVAQALLDGPLLPKVEGHAARLHIRADGRKPTVAELVTWLHAPQAPLRAAAAWGLSGVPLDPGASLALAAAAATDEPAVRFEALRALSSARPLPEVRRTLLAALDDASEATRLAAARALWALPALPEDARRLADGLAHRDAYVRAFAEEALVRVGAPAVPVVVPLLERGEAGVRRHAVRLLGRLGPAALPALDALGACLADTDRGVRRHAARVLGHLGPAAEAARPALTRAASQDEDAEVRAEAELALRRLQAASSSRTRPSQASSDRAGWRSSSKASSRA